MKIAHIVCVYPPYYGGMGNVVFETVSELGKRGHEVAVFTPDYFERKEVKPESEGEALSHDENLQTRIDFAKRLRPGLQYGNAAYMPQLARELEAFDLVHLHYPFFGTAGVVRRWKKRHPEKKLVITYHMDTRAPSWKGLIFSLYSRFWMPKILAVADCIIVSSLDYIRQSRAKEIFAKSAAKWRELPFGVDIERFQPRPKSDDLLVTFDLDETVPTFLFVGGMDPAHYFKGIPVLLQALYLLKKRGMSFQMVLVGDGELRPQYEREAKAMGLESVVRFVGRVSDEDLPQFYNLSDLLILPSIHEGEAFGLVLLEAMASGVPVVASDLAGVRTVAADGGLTVPPKNPAELADVLSGFFSPENDREAWRQNVRDVVLQKYSWEKIVDMLENVYDELVQKKNS